MNCKKAILILALFTGVLGCECFRGTEWNITDYDILIFDSEGNAPVNGMVEGNTLTLRLNFHAEFVEFNYNPFGGLMPSALATTCAEQGDRGLDDRVRNVTITSNRQFNAISPGQPLNDIVSVEGQTSISDWISSSGSWAWRYGHTADIVIAQKPGAGSNHIFTVRVQLNSGKIMEQDSDEVQWN